MWRSSIFPARHFARAQFAVDLCLTVYLSQACLVPKWLNLGSEKQHCTIAQCKRFNEILMGSPDRGHQICWVKITFGGYNSVSQLVEESGSDTLYHQKFASIVTGVYVDGALAEDGIHGVINNVGCRRSSFITRTTRFSVTCMWHRESHASCAIIELNQFITTMHVQQQQRH